MTPDVAETVGGADASSVADESAGSIAPPEEVEQELEQRRDDLWVQPGLTDDTVLITDESERAALVDSGASPPDAYDEATYEVAVDHSTGVVMWRRDSDGDGSLSLYELAAARALGYEPMAVAVGDGKWADTTVGTKGEQVLKL